MIVIHIYKFMFVVKMIQLFYYCLAAQTHKNWFFYVALYFDSDMVRVDHNWFCEYNTILNYLKEKSDPFMGSPRCSFLFGKNMSTAIIVSCCVIEWMDYHTYCEERFSENVNKKPVTYLIFFEEGPCSLLWHRWPEKRLRGFFQKLCFWKQNFLTIHLVHVVIEWPLM